MRAPVAIAATGPVSLAAAQQVARAGGNAVDVAVAAGLAAMSTEPGIVSLAGGAFVAADSGSTGSDRASGRSSRTTAVGCASMRGTAPWRRPAR